MEESYALQTCAIHPSIDKVTVTTFQEGRVSNGSTQSREQEEHLVSGIVTPRAERDSII